MFGLKRIVCLLIALLGLACGGSPKNFDGGRAFDLLIKGGTVIDGSGSAGRMADILVQDGRIAFIGDVNPTKIEAARVIDAHGKVVTPGFIDTHTHGNPMKTPEFRNFTAMGVTSIFLGQDGGSASDIAGWMDEVAAAEPSLNIATMIGHGTIRNVSGVKLNPDPSSDDLEKMALLVENGLKAGAFGLSSGIEYQPGVFAKMDELIAIARPVGRLGGLVQSHIRSEDDDLVQDSIAELLEQGRGGGCPVIVTHMKVVYGHGADRAEQILAQLDSARDSGTPVTADIYPYTASYTGIGIVFPAWALPPNDYKEVIAEKRDELKAYLRKRIASRNGPEATLFGTAPWAGKTLADLALELDKSFEDVLIDDIGPGGASAAYFVMDSELQDRLFIDPHVMVCSDGSPTMRHPRGYGSFAKIIRYYVREKGLLTLEEAVRKMTGLSAKTMGLIDQKRGLLKEGFAADILVFDPRAVNDTATFEDPHKLAEGFDGVIVNGVPVIADKKFTGERGGQVLKKAAITSL